MSKPALPATTVHVVVFQASCLRCAHSIPVHIEIPDKALIASEVEATESMLWNAEQCPSCGKVGMARATGCTITEEAPQLVANG